MYAVLRINPYDEEKVAASAHRLEEFDRIHAAQPGFAGSVVVDLSGGRRFVVNLWESEEHGRAALARLRPEVDRLVLPLLSAPSEFVGAGPVIAWQPPAPSHA